jgi:hypothetical protein
VDFLSDTFLYVKWEGSDVNSHGNLQRTPTVLDGACMHAHPIFLLANKFCVGKEVLAMVSLGVANFHVKTRCQ